MNNNLQSGREKFWFFIVFGNDHKKNKELMQCLLVRLGKKQEYLSILTLLRYYSAYDQIRKNYLSVYSPPPDC